MTFRLPKLSESCSGLSYGVVGIVVAICLFAGRSRNSKLNAIPTVRSGNWVGSWWDGLKHLINASDVIQRGYEKYKPLPFKYAEQYHWMVVVSSRNHIEELLRASDDVLSFEEATNDQIHTIYTLGPEMIKTPYHTVVVRSQLTRNIGALYHEIRDEIITAFDEILDLKDGEWKSIPALRTVQTIVGRASNRAFVGLPLCRDPDWIDLNIQHTIDVVKAGVAIGLFPEFMRPLVARFFTRYTHQGTMRGLRHLGPTIEQRLQYLDEYGKEWDDKPNDLISWLMEEAEGPQLSVNLLVTRVLLVNFAAIHTTSNSFTNALFYLAANPQYIQPLREEVESVVEKEGWSKASLSEMHKLDSFLRESQRLDGTGALSLARKALKDFTFSDGTFIPKGTLVGVAARSIHYDEKIHDNPGVFEPFRWSERRGDDEEESAKYQFVSTGPEYLAFGHGKNACPGRFLAATGMKTMLAHIVVNYDVRLEDNTARPRSIPFSTSAMANPYAKIMFRKRAD